MEYVPRDLLRRDPGREINDHSDTHLSAYSPSKESPSHLSFPIETTSCDFALMVVTLTRHHVLTFQFVAKETLFYIFLSFLLSLVRRYMHLCLGNTSSEVQMIINVIVDQTHNYKSSTLSRCTISL